MKTYVNELKHILGSASTPDRLDDHSWTGSLIVRQKAAEDPALAKKSLGEQLLTVLVRLFHETMPAAPPRRGKRLDTKWARFGILAARYFAPIEFGAVRPTSLRDAWGRIDQAIPLFVFGKPDHDVPETELAPYRLIADEAEVAPSSTLSDWHVKGLERLVDLLLSREEHLSNQLDQPSVILDPSRAPPPAVAVEAESIAVAVPREPGVSYAERLRPLGQLYRRHARRLWLALALVVVLFFGWKGWRVYDLARAVLDEVAQLQTLAQGNPDPDALAAAGPTLSAARRDVAALRAETGPFLWLGRGLGWLPVYGPDLAAAGHLLDLAGGLTVAADEVYQAAWPIWEATQAEDSRPAPSEILELLVEVQPRFAAAGGALEEALAARAAINAERLSPRTRRLLVEKIDPYLPLMQDGLAAATALPKLLGAPGYGPQSYLLLIQNEDELRATGGFITAVGTVTVERGEVIAFALEDSYAVDDLSKPYFPAPWQLDHYMYSHIMLLRDSNWSPDFPTAAAWAERLYAYSRAQAVDGVIAIDQEAIRLLLAAVGPVGVEGAPPVTAENVIDYIRAAKAPAAGEALDRDWWRQRKDFMRPLARGLLAKLQGDAALSWTDLARTALQALDERHVLLQVDDPAVAAALANQGWDGAIRPGPGDYLMVVDSNLGFNKANAAVQMELVYEVDLSDLDAPTAALTVTHRNPASGDAVCKHAPDYGTGDYADLIARCYWDYLRVYTRADAELLEATPHAIPGAWMIRGEPVPARVDQSGGGIFADRIEGVRASGTLLVVPLGKTLETGFRFSLPPEALTGDDEGNLLTYRLRVQKQPGTRAVPLAIHVRLPAGAEVVSAVPAGNTQRNVWQLELTLDTDAEISLTFRQP